MTKLDLLIALQDVPDDVEIRVVNESENFFALSKPIEFGEFTTPNGECYFGIFLSPDKTKN